MAPYRIAAALGAIEPSLPTKVLRKSGGDDGWSRVTELTGARLRELLTDEYVVRLQRGVRYRVTTPWRVAPAEESCDWLLSSRSKRTVVELIGRESRPQARRSSDLERA